MYSLGADFRLTLFFYFIGKKFHDKAKNSAGTARRQNRKRSFVSCSFSAFDCRVNAVWIKHKKHTLLYDEILL